MDLPILESEMSTEEYNKVIIRKDEDGVLDDELPILFPEVSVPEPKKKKSKSKNGSMYVGVQNRNFWLEIQKMYGFDNANNFSTFMLSNMVFFHENVMQSAKLLEDKGLFEIGEVKWLEGYPFCITPEGNVVQLTSNPDVGNEAKKKKSKVVNEVKRKRTKSGNEAKRKRSKAAKSRSKEIIAEPGPQEICEMDMDEIRSDNNPYEIESDLELNKSIDSYHTENDLDVTNDSIEGYAQL